APRPCRAQPPGGDRRAGLAFRALPDLVLATHRASRRARGGEPGARRQPQRARTPWPRGRGRPRLVGRPAHRGFARGPATPRRRQSARHAGLRRGTLSARNLSHLGSNDMIRTLAAALAFVATLATRAVAADYPTRPVALIVAFTPGGPSDVLARIVGRQL